MSPTALRRKYLPRNPDRRGHTPPHPAAAPAAAANQERHPQAHHEHKTQTKPLESSHRNDNLRFKPGFEQETEEQLARIFKRPVRTFKHDTPFYPWLPPSPIVNFHLNFKG
nr:MAG: hypothetical protein [Gammatorquevirus sp.]